MGWFTRDKGFEVLGPSYEARFDSPDGVHHATVQGRFGDQKEAAQRLSQRFSELYPEYPDWELVSITEVKPATRRKRV